jgi:hypothetical protein
MWSYAVKNPSCQALQDAKANFSSRGVANGCGVVRVRPVGETASPVRKR